MYRPSFVSDVLMALGGDIQLVKGPFSVDILIVLNPYWRLMTRNMGSVSDDLIAQKTIFVCILSSALSDTGPGNVGNVSRYAWRYFYYFSREASMLGWYLSHIVSVLCYRLLRDVSEIYKNSYQP